MYQQDIFTYKGGLKSLYDDVKFAVDNSFDQWDLITVTLSEEVCRLQGVLC